MAPTCAGIPVIPAKLSGPPADGQDRYGAQRSVRIGGEAWRGVGSGRWIRSTAVSRSVARHAFRAELLAVPDLVADPAHRLAQRPSPDFGRNDLGHFRERRLDGVGMTAAAMGPQQLRQGGA